MKNTRPPIVTVLGHVDHGKTTLLDSIRKTKFASREAGGITQSTGAWTVKTKEGKKITFIDTPGHAAFWGMRERGVKVADIAVLVVAADDGVKPQTKEAVRYIHEAKIPFLVAINKIDLNSANVEGALGQLEKEGVLMEGRGGTVPKVLVSAKTGKGINDLLETITLISEVEGVGGKAGKDLEGVVIETTKDRRGPVVSVVVRSGSLRVGDVISAGRISAKVRGLFNEKGTAVREVDAGEAALVLGFSELPPVGDKVVSSTGTFKSPQRASTPVVKGTETGKISVLLKTDNQGVLEAILGSLPKEVNVIYSGVGEISESDVFIAKAASALVLAFDTRIPEKVRKLAGTEGVVIESFKVIYELVKKVEGLVLDSSEKILGRAEIVKVFTLSAGNKVAGCKSLEGAIGKKSKLFLERKGKRFGQVKVISMKKEKTEINEAKAGEEFGIYFNPQFDFQVGDMLISIA